MKKATIHIHEFDPVIYPFKIWITITSDINSLISRFITPEGGPLKFSDDYAATTHEVLDREENMQRGALIVFNTKKDCRVKYIAHESSHAAKSLFEYIGAEAMHHETFEYLLGWIADCCEKVSKGKESTQK